jgi:uncharacterized membrane protein
MNRRQATGLELCIVVLIMIGTCLDPVFSYSSISRTAELSFTENSISIACHKGEAKDVPLSIINTGNETGTAVLVAVENYTFIDATVVPYSIAVLEYGSYPVIATVTVSPICPTGIYIVDIILIELEAEIDTLELRIIVDDTTTTPDQTPILIPVIVLLCIAAACCMLEYFRRKRILSRA